MTGVVGHKIKIDGGFFVANYLPIFNLFAANAHINWLEYKTLQEWKTGQSSQIDSLINKAGSKQTNKQTNKQNHLKLTVSLIKGEARP